SIVHGNGGIQIFSYAGAITTVEYSDVQGGYAGPGNIDADPLFADADGRLGPGSPCIDAASNPAVPVGIEVDLDGNPRFVDDPCREDTGLGDLPIVDMGAYEFQDRSCDLDGGDTVGVTDFLALLAAWGPCPQPCAPSCPADFDGNCVVGVTDFLVLLANWG
ncbi:MAG: choice-of-anchor Q domain-containing protein, partial [Planctomycetota bacterium]